MNIKSVMCRSHTAQKSQDISWLNLSNHRCFDFREFSHCNNKNKLELKWLKLFFYVKIHFLDLQTIEKTMCVHKVSIVERRKNSLINLTIKVSLNKIKVMLWILNVTYVGVAQQKSPHFSWLNISNHHCFDFQEFCHCNQRNKLE